jgi:hypothetical protein
MIADDNSSSPWPTVSPDDIVVPDFGCDLAYMGFYLRLEVCNHSPYLVREVELRIDGRGQTVPRIVTSREIRVGPLFPGVIVHEEVGIGAREGISGFSFESVAAHAVRLTPPAEMVPAAEYPELVAEVVDVTSDKEAPDLGARDDDEPGEPPKASAKAIRVRVHNRGPAVVERARLKLKYFEALDEHAGSKPPWADSPVTEWILDMPRRDWNPYELPPAPDAACDPADPLPPGQAYEFTLVHHGGGPHDWGGRLEFTSVEVCELKLG